MTPHLKMVTPNHIKQKPIEGMLFHLSNETGRVPTYTAD